MQIEMLTIEALRPYARNARVHSKKQVRQIADSIRRFGFCNPVLVDDQLQIIAGHGRVAAAIRRSHGGKQVEHTWAANICAVSLSFREIASGEAGSHRASPEIARALHNGKFCCQQNEGFVC
jgi:hypothetical protein